MWNRNAVSLVFFGALLISTDCVKVTRRSSASSKFRESVPAGPGKFNDGVEIGDKSSSSLDAEVLVGYTDSWVVELEGGRDEADRLASKYGFRNMGQVSFKKLGPLSYPDPVSLCFIIP